MPRADPADERGWRHPDTEELALLRALHERGDVEVALHGLDHLDSGGAERPSELRGRSREDLRERLDRGTSALAQHGIEPSVFVAPWDRFDRIQYGLLAERFAVVSGGTNSVETIGWHAAPLWRGQAVYLPVSGALDGAAADARREVQALVDERPALWIGVTLRWAEESLEHVTELCDALGGVARPWSELLAAVRASSVWGADASTA